MLANAFRYPRISCISVSFYSGVFLRYRIIIITARKRMTWSCHVNTEALSPFIFVHWSYRAAKYFAVRGFRAPKYPSVRNVIHTYLSSLTDIYGEDLPIIAFRKKKKKKKSERWWREKGMERVSREQKFNLPFNAPERVFALISRCAFWRDTYRPSVVRQRENSAPNRRVDVIYNVAYRVPRDPKRGISRLSGRASNVWCT